MKVAVAGATGLIGSHLVGVLQDHPSVDETVVLTRHPVSPQPSVSIEEVDYEDEDSIRRAIRGCRVAFCALGTTMKKAGSKEAFRKVDFEYVVRYAEAAGKEGVTTMAVVSAMGADSNSMFFYNRVKGDMEKALDGLDFAHLVIAQPSILLGDRGENRRGERVGIAVGKFLSPLMVGPLKKYRPIHAEQVARGMATAALRPRSEGSQILQWPDFSTSD